MLSFLNRERATLRERLLEAIKQGLKAKRVLFVALGEGFYVHVMPPIYDFLEERERFERESAEARKAVLGDAALGRYALINFREIRDSKLPYAYNYQDWARRHADKLTGDIGLIFLVREAEVREVITHACERRGLTCEPHGQWDVRIVGTSNIIYTGDLVYEAIGRARNISELVQEHLASL